MRRTSAIAAALAITLAAAALFSQPRPSGAADEDEAPLDYRFYKTRVAPLLHEQCGECHANPRKRSKVGKFFLSPAPGRRMRERFQERNFKNVLRFVEPGDPSASLLLLKAIGPRNGGVTHEGGDILGTNTPAYGAIIDWINGQKQAVEAFKPPTAETGAPDFLFFYKRIEPVLLAVCAECHAGRGKGRFKLVTHERGEEFPLEDHYANFETIMRLVKPGQPLKSRFFTKPLALDAGGIKHKGGDRIAKDSVNYENWMLFIQGESGPPLPTEGEKNIPVLTNEGLTIQAEDFEFEGGVEDAESKGAEEYYVAVAGETGGRIHVDMRVADAGAYRVEVRFKPGTAPLHMGFEGAEPWTLPIPPADEREEHGFARAGPLTLLDHADPLIDSRGGLDLQAGVLHMDGRRGEAAWLSPSDVRNAGALARIRLADEEEGGDDGLLLFDMEDGWNGKFAGLTDGGRRFVMGVLENGRMRVLKSAKATEPRRGTEGDPREVKVEYFGGVAVGSLDGKPLVFLNLSGKLEEGRFGVMTHGLAEIHHVAAVEEYEVYEVELQTGPVIHLPTALLRLFVEIPPGGGEVDSVRFTPSE
ncbi:MAG: hypothetical protein P1V36_06055 [Planctomycetota bacterium]|nr:hypothetical protein [Planctomycetota bacterium]